MTQLFRPASTARLSGAQPTSGVRFGGILPRGSLGLLAKNSSQLLGNYGVGTLHNLELVKTNAFILSSLIQVLSRVIVAKKTARDAEGTPQADFRGKEFVKTMFREFLGFTLSYLVLRKFQAGAVDFFGAMLHVSKGIPTKPTVLNGMFRKLFNAPLRTTEDSIRMFPALGRTLRKVGTQIGRYWNGTQGAFSPNAQANRVAGLFAKSSENKLVTFDAVGRAKQLGWLKKPIDFVFHNRFLEGKTTQDVAKFFGEAAAKGMSKTDADALLQREKVTAFLRWVPPLLGSIPAVALSGFALETFTQKKAEPWSQKIASILGSHPTGPAVIFPDEPLPAFQPNAMTGQLPVLDPIASVPYAANYAAGPNPAAMPVAAPGWTSYAPVSTAFFAPQPAAVAGQAWTV